MDDLIPHDGPYDLLDGPYGGRGGVRLVDNFGNTDDRAQATIQKFLNGTGAIGTAGRAAFSAGEGSSRVQGVLIGVEAPLTWRNAQAMAVRAAILWRGACLWQRRSPLTNPGRATGAFLEPNLMIEALAAESVIMKRMLAMPPSCHDLARLMVGPGQATAALMEPILIVKLLAAVPVTLSRLAGGCIGHRITKPLPAPGIDVVTTGGGANSTPQGILRYERSQWKEYWQASDCPRRERCDGLPAPERDCAGVVANPPVSPIFPNK
jgi:hypothetical protein